MPAIRVLFVALLALLPFSLAARELALTEVERQWLEQHAAPLRVGVTEIPPVVVKSDDQRVFSGLAIDFLRAFEKSLGFSSEIVLFPNMKAMMEAAARQEIDLVLPAIETPSRRAYLLFPPPYAQLRNVIVGRQGETDGDLDLGRLAGKRVAVLEASAVHERLAREFPKIRVYPLRDAARTLAAVAQHDADFAIVELSRAVWWMQQDKVSALRVVGTTPLDNALSIGVRKDWPELNSALGKAVEAINGPRGEAIVRQWANVDVDRWLERSAMRRPFLVGVVFALVGVLFALAAIWLLRGRLAVQTAAREKLRVYADTLHQRLSESERKFRELAELTSDIFWETDEQLVLVRYYGGAALTGVVASNLLGKKWWELSPVRADAKAFEHLREMMETRQPFRRWLCRFSEDSGKVRWLSLSGRAAFEKDGRFTGYRGAGQDITDRMQQQQRLTEALERMQAVHDGTYSFLGLLSPDGRTVDCNRSALEFVGLQRSEVIGRLYWELPWWKVADESARVAEAVAAAARGEFVRFDARMIDTAGATHWIDFSLRPFYDEWGNLVYLVPEARDITEAKRASTALESLISSTGSVFGEAFFRKVVESMGRLLAVRYVFIGRLLPAPARRVRTVAVWAGEGRVDDFEYELAGTPCANAVDLGCCIYPRDVQTLFPEDERLFRLGVQAYAGVPVIGAGGKSIGVLVVLHDRPMVETVSMRRILELFAVRAATEFERVSYEAEIQTLNTGLEARVAERTEALTQVNRELEAFSYSVSHDLRAPLRHISGFIELFVEEVGETLTPEARRYLDIVSQSAARMGRMIDDLLAFSRAGRSEVRKTRLDLGQLVAESIQQMERDTAARRIDWRIGELPVVDGDRGLIQLVLANLIGNAVKYTRKREPAVIEIVAHRSENAGDWVICVRDNGVGFDMKYGHKLFGVFQRLHNDSDYEGTGIGLANVRRIVERHGGRVWAEGAVDRGSTFCFTLPNVAGEASNGTPAA